MAGNDEDLQKNPLFIYFTQTSEIFTRAAKLNYVICIPVKDSLKAVKITKDFLCSHVLKLSPYLKDEYMTLNGKVRIHPMSPDQLDFLRRLFHYKIATSRRNKVD